MSWKGVANIASPTQGWCGRSGLDAIASIPPPQRVAGKHDIDSESYVRLAKKPADQKIY